MFKLPISQPASALIKQPVYLLTPCQTITADWDPLSLFVLCGIIHFWCYQNNVVNLCSFNSRCIKLVKYIVNVSLEASITFRYAISDRFYFNSLAIMLFYTNCQTLKKLIRCFYLNIIKHPFVIHIFHNTNYHFYG